MRLAEGFYKAEPIPQTVIDDAVIRIVEMNNGMKDTAIVIAVLAEIATHPGIQSSTDPRYAVVMVAKTIHRLIHAGRLVAVDCETPIGSFTFVLPAGSRPSIALPIFVSDNRTRH